MTLQFAGAFTIPAYRAIQAMTRDTNQAQDDTSSTDTNASHHILQLVCSTFTLTQSLILACQQTFCTACKAHQQMLKLQIDDVVSKIVLELIELDSAKDAIEFAHYDKFGYKYQMFAHKQCC